MKPRITNTRKQKQSNIIKMCITKVALLVITINTLASFANCARRPESFDSEKRIVEGIPVLYNNSAVVKIVSTRGLWDKNCVGAVIHREYVLTLATCVTSADKIHVFINNMANSRKMRRNVPTVNESHDEMDGRDEANVINFDEILNEALQELKEIESNSTLRRNGNWTHGLKHKKLSKGGN